MATTDLIRYDPPPQQIVRADSDEDLIAVWLRGKRNPKTRALYLYTIKGFREVVPGPLASLTLNDLEDYRESLAHLRPATQAQRIATIKSLLSFGHKTGYLKVNVGAAIQPPKGKNTLAERILSQEEVLRMLVASKANPRNELFLRLIYRSGGRVSEIVTATWADLIAREDSAQITLFGKRDKTRVVALSLDLYHALQMLRDGAADTDRIFPITRQRAWKIIKAIAKRAGISGKVSPHWFRHSHATHALDNGADLNLVSQTLGHSDLAITGMYLHVRPGSSSGDYLKVG